jgi:SEC-C motif
MKKIGRNEPCSCGSGQKYKYCCKGFEHKVRKPHTPSEIIAPEGMEIFKKIMAALSSEEEPLRCFCKDNGFYFFKIISIADSQELTRKLLNNTLTKEDFFACYRKHTTHEYVERMLETAIKQSDAFKKRQSILQASVKAHFNKDYTLSIPSFFIIIEGILRDIGKLEPKQTFKPTMTIEGLEEKVLYTNSDSISYFNSFITNLYAGSQDDNIFNRNTILHGVNNDSFSEDNSLVLLLALLEIQNYIFHDRSWPPKLKIENGGIIFYHPNT